MPIIPAPRRLRQEDREFKVALGYIESLGMAGLPCQFLSQAKKRANMPNMPSRVTKCFDEALQFNLTERSSDVRKEAHVPEKPLISFSSWPLRTQWSERFLPKTG